MMDPIDSHLGSEASEDFSFFDLEDFTNLSAGFAMDVADLSEESLSISSCESAAKGMSAYPNVCSQPDSACSSPFEECSDGQKGFHFWELDDAFLACESGAKAGLDNLCMMSKWENDVYSDLLSLDDMERMESESGDDSTMFQDAPFDYGCKQSSALKSYEMLKLLIEKTGDLHRRNPKRQIDHFGISEANFPEKTLAQQAAIDGSDIVDSSIALIDKIMSLSQQQPQLNQRLQQQEVKPCLQLKIRNDKSDTMSVIVHGSNTEPRGNDQASSTPLKLKRKKRKYERRASARKSIQLFEFMLELLDKEDESVTWVSREDGVFKLLKSKSVAEMWGKYKKNENMTYESLSRALRHYYAQEILVPVPKKLHYKFCKKTLDNWYKCKEIR